MNTPDFSRLLTSEEIRDRLIRFNETNDWSVFDDVPPVQHVCVMYPHMSPEVLEVYKTGVTFDEAPIKDLLERYKALKTTLDYKLDEILSKDIDNEKFS